MADLLAAGAAWIADTFKADVSQSVVVSDGTHSVTLSATLGNRPAVIDANGAIQLASIGHTFVIDPADLVLNGATVEPQEGYTITATIGGQTSVYTVVQNNGGPCFERDRYNTRLTIHAVKTA